MMPIFTLHCPEITATADRPPAVQLQQLSPHLKLGAARCTPRYALVADRMPRRSDAGATTTQPSRTFAAASDLAQQRKNSKARQSFNDSTFKLTAIAAALSKLHGSIMATVLLLQQLTRVKKKKFMSFSG